MAKFLASTHIRLPGTCIRKTFGQSEYIYAGLGFWSGREHVDLSRPSDGQDAGLWEWMNELLWTCKRWEIFGQRQDALDPKGFAGMLMGKMESESKRKAAVSAGYIGIDWS